jgi:hypothetical protein
MEPAGRRCGTGETCNAKICTRISPDGVVLHYHVGHLAHELHHAGVSRTELVGEHHLGTVFGLHPTGECQWT